MAAADPQVLIGDRYRVIGELGQGTGSDVLHGEDLVLHRPIAVKLVKPEHTAAYRESLSACARVSHPAFVGIFDVIEYDGRLVIVQEFVNGQTFADLALAELAPVEIARIGRQIALALSHAHLHGVTHGDLTPAAILRDRWGDVRLNDLALPPDRDYFVLAGRLLAPGADPWTPDRSPADDLRALGVVLWLLLACRPLPPETLTGLASDWELVIRPVPDSLRDIVERLADPAHPRAFGDAELLARELAACARALEPRDPAQRPPWELPRFSFPLPDASQREAAPTLPAVAPSAMPDRAQPAGIAQQVGPPLSVGEDNAPTLQAGPEPAIIPERPAFHRRDVLFWLALGLGLFLFWLLIGYFLPGIFGR
jgi:serine/threonine protein kinase